MKLRWMESVQGQNRTEMADKMIEWAHKHGKTVRGHALLWSKKKNNPDWVQDLYGEDMKKSNF